MGCLYTSSFSGFMKSRKEQSSLHVNNKERTDFKVSEKIDATSQNTILVTRLNTDPDQKISASGSSSLLLTQPEFWGTVIIGSEMGWQKMEKFCVPPPDFVRSQLHRPEDTLIYVYTPLEDKWISGNIIRRGIWEGTLVKRIHNIMKNEPEVVFLDIGANVGVFSLTIAKLGRYVIVVDALEGNIAHLCRSVQDGNLGSHVTIIHNALSYQREKVALGTYEKNVGGTYVKKLEKMELDKVGQNSLVVDAILLDDLLEIFNIKRAVIKMDVETFEANILKGAEKFFKAVVVEYLFIEFMSHRGKDSGDFIVDFLKNHSLVSEFSNSNHSIWPDVVMFKRATS
ncbi:uncharacterized protein LOC134247136 [Saccostrea cucullata]|uniref:uncharacterized protein LOC134247136 n=1 Tax=Saccostrea cuccullata TaxID=36930 RepID=UPI002ED418C9